MTNEQLKELLGQVTPGNWFVQQVAGYQMDYIMTDHPELQPGNGRAAHANYIGETGSVASDRQRFEADARLMALSKSLAEELIEVREALAERVALGRG